MPQKDLLPIRPPKTEEKKSSVEKVIGFISKISQVVIHLRDKPKRLDWIALGLSMADIGIAIKNELHNKKKLDSSKFFDAKYYKLPTVLKQSIMECIERPFVIGECDGMDNFICSGYIDEEQVWWRCDRTNIDRGPYILSGTEEKFMDCLGKKMWNIMGFKNLVYTEDGGISGIDETPNFEVVETSNATNLTKRIKSFLDADKTRSYLLVGQPGTGKSIGVVTAINALNLSSFRTTISAMTTSKLDYEGISAIENVEAIIMSMRPDVLILDDIDRIYGGSQLLSILERARRYCKVIIATANNKNEMLGAMLRAGRFDDHIEYEHIDEEVVRQLVGDDDPNVIAKMAKWPIAYVKNYKEIKDVLGIEVAHSEVDDIQSVIESAKKKKKEEEKK